jgi:hypothetical protein
MPNSLKLTPTNEGLIKVRVVSAHERDQSAVVSFDELQEMIRATQTGDEAELPLEPEEAPAEPDAVEPDEAPPTATQLPAEPEPEVPPVDTGVEGSQRPDDQPVGSDPGEDNPLDS